MKTKKFLSCFLVVGTIAFSGPMAFAEWESIDYNLTQMINFNKFRNKRQNWCWLSTSLKLIEYWIKKYNPSKDDKNVNKRLLEQFKIMSGCVRKNYRNFQIYEPLFKELNNVVMGYGKQNFNIMLDQQCEMFYISEAVKEILNKIFDNKKNFEACYYDWTTKSSNSLPYDIAKSIILESKCPIVVGLGLVRPSEQRIIKDADKDLKKHGSHYIYSEFLNDAKIDGHCYLVTGINDNDSEKSIRLVDPSGNKVVEFSKKEFNSICLSLMSVKNKTS